MDKFTAWADHNGGDVDIGPLEWVEVKFRAPPNCGQVNPFENGAYAFLVNWSHDGANDDVVQYRVRLPRHD